jgi:hypothetical protein
MKRHIRDVSGAVVECSQLRTKYDSYSSFFVKCDEDMQQRLMKSNYWPQGVMVRQFFD